MITPIEFADKMKEIRKENVYDLELRHVLMDELMCEVLGQFGYDEGVYIFEESDKWYA